MIYDFILFEQALAHHNHFPELTHIARLLKANGYTVAIADLTEQCAECQLEGVPHITFKNKNKARYYDVDTPALQRKALNWVNARVLLHRINQVLDNIQGQYRNLYVGTYWSLLPTSWLNKIPASACCFFWAHRSWTLEEYKYSKSTAAVHCKQFRDYIEHHVNIKFFVSDELIRKEVIGVGIEPQRLVLRPERTLDAITVHERPMGQGLNLLTIGKIQRNKQIEKILDGLNEAKNQEINYTIAGEVVDHEYEETIKAHIKGNEQVNRIDHRLTVSEFSETIDNCDALLLAIAKTHSTVTSGTMNDALLKGKPIIAPDYDPFKTYIQQYGIGVTYNPDDPQSLPGALEKITETGIESYYEGIKRYQQTLLFDNVSKQFGKELKEVIGY